MGNGKTRVKHDNGGESQKKGIGNYISVTSCQTTKKFIMVSKTFVFVTKVLYGSKIKLKGN
jgi:hypothetical protein